MLRPQRLDLSRGAMYIPPRNLRERTSTTNFRSSMPTAFGLLVTNASLGLVSANQEAVRILTYPGRQTWQSVTEGFEKKVQSGFRSLQLTGNTNPPPVDFKSGRRTYFCRAFVVDGQGKASDASNVVVVLERGTSASCVMSQISAQFRLTPREQQATALLLKGLSNKEMAERLGISANTVKAFLRSVMIKMGASSRSGITSKVLGLVLSSNEPHPD